MFKETALTLLLTWSGVITAFRPMSPMRLQRGVTVSMAFDGSPATDLVLGANPTIEEWMDVAEPGLKKATMGMFRAVKEIAYKIRTASCDKVQCFGTTASGDQVAIDILANNVIFQNLRQTGVVAVASSKETPTEDRMGGKGYAVAFDPLDGASVIDTNFAVGTIWAIYQGEKLTGIKGSQVKSAGIAMYGPRTTITLALDNMPGSHEFLLIDDYSAMHGQWVKSNEFTQIGEGKLLAPGNLRATQDNKGYADLFNYWMTNMYQLRYTGGLVADANQIMVKGKGIMCNVASKSTGVPLSILYEVAPVGYLIEKAGGRTSDGEKSVLEIPITYTEQNTQCAFGSAGEIKRFEEMVGKKYM